MERSCSDCPAPRPAQSLCTLCNKWLCYQCTNMHQHHQRPLATSQYADLDLHQQQQQQQQQPPPPSASHCPEGMHTRGPGSLALPPADTGVGGTQPPPPRSPLLMCHTHRQEPLELFCESCDLLCCSSCHLSGHKNHRLVHIGKALQDQQWLFERLAAQLDERRASVENTAKQVEDRLHGVKIMQRKAENQIKMAKMIMMNELNKRASLLIEQLEKISEDFQQRLDDQLQGAIEICGQLDHVHKFVTWATTQHCRSPVLFSKDLISIQMQQLLEPSLYLDSWLPVKIRFNWDASYWTKLVASLGQLSVEGGNCPFPEALSLSCPSILRPQPVSCLSLPSACQRGREQGCGGGGYQACCQPQLCCLHAAAPPPPPLPDLSAGMHKSQLDPAAYSSGCGVASALPTATAGPHQGQTLLSCWDPQSNNPGIQAASLQCPLPPPPPPPPPPPLPPHASSSAPSPGPGAVHLSGSHDNLTSHPQHGALQPPSKPSTVERSPGKHSLQQCAELQGGLDLGKTSTPGRPPGPGASAEGDGMAVDSWEGRQRGEEHGHRHTVVVAGVRAEQSNGGWAPWEERVEQATAVQVEQHAQGLAPAEWREQQQGTRAPPPAPPPPPPPPPPPLPGDYRDARSPLSPETLLTAQESGAEPSRRCSASACGRMTRSSRCSQSIPAEPPPPAGPAPAASPASSCSAGARGGATAAGTQSGAHDQCGRVEARRRRASDGVIQCVAGQRTPGPGVRPRCRGQSSLHLPVAPVLYYKTEPDNTFSKDETEYEVEEKCHKARNGKNQNSERDARQPADSPKVPVVCLERLKVLVSRLPPHGRRQSDPLPASAGVCSQKTAWADGRAEGAPGGVAFKRATLLFNTPPYTASRSPGRLPAEPGVNLYSRRGSAQPTHVPSDIFSADLDLDSDSETEVLSEAEPEYDPQLDSDVSPESEPHLGSLSSSSSSSEVDPDSVARTESPGGEEETDPGRDWDAPRGASEPLGRDYGPPGSASSYGAHRGLGDAEDLDAAEDVDSEVEESELDTEARSEHHLHHQQQQQRHPDSDPNFQADDSDSDIISTHPRDSQFSGESDPELDLSEPDVNNNEDDDDDNDDDEPQPLRSDLDEGSPTGSHRAHLLIANPSLQRVGGAAMGVAAGGAEMESEDFCAVCLIGGELLCCDRCPKVFHLSCHIPPLLNFPTGDWICTLCRDFLQPEVEYDCENERTASVHGLSSLDQRKCQRLTLLIFTNVLSAPFHEPVSPLARHYYQIIKRPMDLSQIRTRLSKSNTRHYSTPEEFVADVYLMFRNCAKFNYPDSEVAQAGRSLESFFNSRLNEAFPLGVFLPVGEIQSDSDDEYDEACRAAENGFPWPERREQCHRKRKRRHSLNSRKHHA